MTTQSEGQTTAVADAGGDVQETARPQAGLPADRLRALVVGAARARADGASRSTSPPCGRRSTRSPTGPGLGAFDFVGLDNFARIFQTPELIGR